MLDELTTGTELRNRKVSSDGELMRVTGRTWASRNAHRPVQQQLAHYHGHTSPDGDARLLVPGEVAEIVRWGRAHNTCAAVTYPRRVASEDTVLVGVDVSGDRGRIPDLVIELNIKGPIGLHGEVVDMLGHANRWPTLAEEMAAWSCLASSGLLDGAAVRRIPSPEVARLLARVVTERDSVEVHEDAAAAAGGALWLAGHQRQLDLASPTTPCKLAHSGPVTPERRPRDRAESLSVAEQLPLRHRTARRLLLEVAVPPPTSVSHRQLQLQL